MGVDVVDMVEVGAGMVGTPIDSTEMASSEAEGPQPNEVSVVVVVA